MTVRSLIGPGVEELDLRERAAIVTGASRGIGRALAGRLAREGCRLVLVARSAAELEAVRREVEGLGSPSAVACPGDVSDSAAAKRAVGLALERFSRLDVLVNNAGLGLRAPVARMEPADLDYVFRVNVLGALNFIREAVPHLVEQGEGLVVFVSSISARQPVPYLGGYAATKAALASLADSLRMELAGTGVKVLTVFPGSVETHFKIHARGEPYPERKGASRLRPEEVADKVVRAALAGNREVLVLSRSERTGLLLGRLLPGVVEKTLIKRYGDPGSGAGRAGE